MPEINEFKCNKCSFELPKGWGGYAYQIGDNGERIEIPHPAEMRVFFKHWKRRKRIEGSTGFNSYCLCLDCLKSSVLDLGDEENARKSIRYFYGCIKKRDERKCPSCGSENVRTVSELVGNICPKCRQGIIQEVKTGVVC
jgi:predicted RNA-binding Zn-ribbon protein involved in translation (DUF1610 family)